MKPILAALALVLVLSIVSATTLPPTTSSAVVAEKGPFLLQNSGRHCCLYNPKPKAVTEERTFIERETFLYTWTDVIGTKLCYKGKGKPKIDRSGMRWNFLYPRWKQCPITVTRSSINYRTKLVRREMPVEKPGRCDEDSIVCCKHFVEWKPLWATKPECVEVEFANYLRSSGMWTQ